MRRADVVRASLAALGVSIAGAASWGCAPNEGAAPKAPESRALEPAEPATVEQAQAQLERARAELAGAVTAPTTPATYASAVSTPGVGATTESTQAGPAPAASTAAGRESRCGHACGAMSSMRRAVEAICRLAGETHARCSDARRTLKDSEARVVGCGCPPQ
jgi:hypothetical protein